MLFTSGAPTASGFMVAWWGVRRTGSPDLWWAVTASWLGSCCCWTTPWRVAAAWCCARARRGSGRPGRREGAARRAPPGGGPGRAGRAEEAAAWAAARGVPVAWARVADRDSLPPYGLWQLVLDEPAVRAADDDPSGAGLWQIGFGDAARSAR